MQDEESTRLIEDRPRLVYWGVAAPSSSKERKNEEVEWIRRNFRCWNVHHEGIDERVTASSQGGHDGGGLYQDPRIQSEDMANTSAEPKSLSTVPVLEATDAYGVIRFSGGSPFLAKYVRLEQDSSLEKVLELLSSKWRLRKPKFLISLIEGSDKLKHVGQETKRDFRRGLVKAAISTGAWIITGGTHRGITRQVGKAAHEYAAADGYQVDPVIIGVSSWGCLTNKYQLQNLTYTKDHHVSVTYRVSGRGSLNPHHTHFLLVDNGSCDHHGAEVNFRTRLEKKLSEVSGESSGTQATPVVRIALESGGQEVTRAVLASLEENVPVVLFKGSPSEDNSVAQKILDQCDEDRKPLLIVHNMASDPCVAKTICRAVLQMPGRRAVDKLRLAQAWGHPDMALKFIKQSQDDATDLTTYDQLFLKALLKTQTTLVKEFITTGVVRLRSFLARGNVLTLYKYACKENRCFSNAVQHHLGREIMTLSDIGLVLQGLLDSSGPVLYCSESADHSQFAAMEEVEDPEEQYKADAKSLYRVSQTHLFIWCIITNRRELARYFWNSAKEGTALALVAQQLLQELRELTEDSWIQRHLQESAQFFAKFAVGYLDFLYRQDEARCRKLLVRVSEIAGQTTVLGLALKVDNRGFVAHPACQSFMNAIWRGNIAPNTSKMMLLLTLVLPFVAGRVMRRRSKADHVIQVTMETADDSSEDAWFCPESEKSHHLVNQKEESLHENESDCCACLEFYNTPVVKFISNTLFLVGFLLLFSIKLCCFFDRKFTWLDCLLLVWVFTLICQEIHEVVSFEGNTIICKIRDYISDVWNMMDVGSNVLFLVGFGLRYVDGCSQCLQWGRIVAGVSCTLYFVRLIDIFSVIKDIGPKIIMIGRMLKDLSAYALVLLVFVLGFGVVSQALLFPDSELTPSLLRDILQRPYFQIFGDHDLDEIEGTNCRNGTTEVPCPDHLGADVITVFLAVYILLTNILVLNLIIAMFSFTVSHIHENTNEVWHTQRYHVIRDYYHRPVLPPPLIILNHLYDLCLALKHYMKLSQEEDDALVTWEHMHAGDFVRCQVKGETEKH